MHRRNHPGGGGAVAILLDGVLVPMKDDHREAKAAPAEAEGKAASGPAHPLAPEIDVLLPEWRQSRSCAPIDQPAPPLVTEHATFAVRGRPERSSAVIKERFDDRVIPGSSPELRVGLVALGIPMGPMPVYDRELNLRETASPFPGSRFARPPAG